MGGEKDDVRKINVVMDQQRNHGRWSGAVGMAGPPTKKKNEQRERGAMDRQTDREGERVRRKAEIKTQHEQHRKFCILSYESHTMYIEMQTSQSINL